MTMNMKHFMRKLVAGLTAAALALMLPIGSIRIPMAIAETPQYSAASLLDTVSVLIDTDFTGNRLTVRYLLDSALSLCDTHSAGYALLQNAREALDRDDVDAASIEALITAARAVLALEVPGVTPTPAVSPDFASEEPQDTPLSATLPPRHTIIPAYVASGYQTVALADRISVQVPSDWGGSASKRAVASYSPVNKSGAISPKAGTLTTTFLPRDAGTDDAVLDTYEEGLEMMSVNSGVISAREQISSMPARRIRYQMDIGSNQFDCEVVCFIDTEYLYTVGMVQGSKSEYDYFTVFDQIVDNLHSGTAATVPTPTAVPDLLPEPQPALPTGSFISGEDMAGFAYLLDGRRLTFPTIVSAFGPSGIPVGTTSEIHCDLTTADHLGGSQYYYYPDAMNREMIGVTNLTGRDATIAEGHVTALVDTMGGNIQLELPGGVCVGASESTVWRGFPEFAVTPIDGNGRFHGRDILYAVGETARGDRSHGYVIIRNDPPLYSALSVICRDGTVVEIKYECLGQAQGMTIFL